MHKYYVMFCNILEILLAVEAVSWSPSKVNVRMAGSRC